jgi:hypothetical protein
MCRHNFQQLLDKKGKPVVKRFPLGLYYSFFCTKCGLVKEVS